MKKFLTLSLAMSLLSVPAWASVQYYCSNKASLEDGGSWLFTPKADGSVKIEKTGYQGDYTREGSATGAWVSFSGTIRGVAAPGEIGGSKESRISKLEVQYPLLNGARSGGIKVDRVSYTCNMQDL